ncbi:MAG: tetratricopeptide repeat protein [Chloroflexi bacterium]|nr:tetratricopeptide repeat protein [Chloroflexota bacterium]
MTYQEEERTRLKRQSSRQAILLAMEGRWQEAVAANKTIIESFPNDVDACNRLGRAYIELGEYAQAREAYEKTVELDPYNTIAQRNLSRLSRLGEEAAAAPESGVRKVDPQQFIEEVGKAGVVILSHLAPPQTLAKTVAGERVNLKADGSTLLVENELGEYLGQVEPRHGQRLVKLMEGGNRYSAAVVSAAEDAVTVMVREVFQHPNQSGRLSFPPRGTEGLRTYAGDRLGERIIRRGLEYEEPEDRGFAIVGGEETAADTELLAEDTGEEEELEGE